MIINTAHFFSGAGGDVTGFKMAGLKPVMALEIGADRCATLRHNHTELNIFEKPIQQFTLAEYPADQAHVHFYTYPCHRYTKGAAIHGTQTGDSLYLEVLREAVLKWPEVIVIENVLGMRHFKRVMETWTNLAHYYCTEMVIQGEWFGLQKKTRIFLILHRQPFLFKSLDNYSFTKTKQCLSDYLDRDVVVKEIPAYIHKRMAGEYRDKPKVYQPEQTTPINLTTNYKRDRSLHLVADSRYEGGVRPFSVSEVARLHGFPEGYTFYGSLGERYGQVVDAVMPSAAKALGHALQEYFACIGNLAVVPKPLGHTQLKRTKAATGYTQLSLM